MQMDEATTNTMEGDGIRQQSAFSIGHIGQDKNNYLIDFFISY
jgi:hypothetical protein